MTVRARTRLLIPIVLTCALAGCGSTAAVNGAGGLSGTPAASTPPSSGTTTPATTPTTPGTTQTVGGPVPAAFTARDLTFVSPTTGWLLGIAPCTSAPCTSIVHTTDGGHTWIGLPTPRADLAPVGQNGCTAACVWGLRFANTSVGYAFGPTALYLTSNGGEKWTKEAGQADAIEIGNGTALRVGHTTQGCPPGCTYQISSAPIGSTAWHTIAAPVPLLGNEVRLLRTGHHAYLEIYQNMAGGAEDAHATLLTSTDDGQHWTKRTDPCGTSGGVEADSTGMAVASDGSLTVLCTRRDFVSSFVVTSSDGGSSFGARHATPGASADAVGAASATTLLVAVHGSLYRSSSAGAAWTKVATAAIPASPDVSAGVIGFQTGQAGWWVPGAAAVLSTTNAGATWNTYTFH
jgi:photosystem II stability/assembly factor-like uncharacterized protein